jgi:imidazolonepropionase-like amidohydrolase
MRPELRSLRGALRGFSDCDCVPFDLANLIRDPMKALLVVLLLAIVPSPLGVFGQATLFSDVNVVTMEDERILENQAVLVRGGRIEAIGTLLEVGEPEDAVIIDGRGMYLMPGLAEMHGHVPSQQSQNLPARYVEDVLFLYLAGGVTTVRGMLGHDNQLNLRDAVNEGRMAGPTLYLAGPSFSGNSIGSPEEARERVRLQHEEGWDLLKVHPGLSLAEFEAMADEANRLGIAFAGHVPTEVGLERAIQLGIETVDHLDGYIDFMGAGESPATDEQLQQAVSLTRDHGVWVVPTQVLWETLIGAADHDELRSFDELKYMPRSVREGWNRFLDNQAQTSYYAGENARIHAENRQKLLKALQDGGVQILMGTDAPQLFSVPGLALRRELPKMRDAGLTPYEIFVSGTRNVGEYFADKDDFGTVTIGARADLLLLPRNPLEDVTVIEELEGVMVRGQWLPREMIDERLAQIEAAYRD